jgi:alpha 1,3-glucosidase
MIGNLSAKGRKMVTIIDPHIKRDSDYHIHQEAQAQSLYIRDRDGNEYDGWCWPGEGTRRSTIVLAQSIFIVRAVILT